jgi:hypothetical protein
MLPIEEIRKPSNAGWIARVVINPDAEVRAAPAVEPSTSHRFGEVDIAWYGDDRIKITLKDGGPALIRQAYLSGSGRNVILDVVAASDA